MTSTQEEPLCSQTVWDDVRFGLEKSSMPTWALPWVLSRSSCVRVQWGRPGSLLEVSWGSPGALWEASSGLVDAFGWLLGGSL